VPWAAKADLQVEMQVHKIEAGDVLMLCSDGLTTMVARRRDGASSSHRAGDDLDEEASKSLVAAANDRGGCEDNITVPAPEVPGVGSTAS
jgi:protein phosphatase